MKTLQEWLEVKENVGRGERNRSVTCRLSEGERAIAEALAAKWGISVASLTRRLLTGLAMLVLADEGTVAQTVSGKAVDVGDGVC